MSSVKPQYIHKLNDVKIAAYFNKSNNLMVPVKCGAVNDEFIFDTGANLSTIAESYAEKMGLTIYEADIEVGSSTHIKIKTKLAVADSIYIGDLLCENVVFLVSPDEHLNFPSINFSISGIIGFPVISEMEEIHMFKNGEIFIPKEPQDKHLQNMCLDDLNPIIQMQSDNDTLFFTLDTGASNTDLSKHYYDKHKEKVERQGTLVNSKRGGAGGIIDVEEYKLKDFPFIIGSQKGILPEMTVALNAYSFNKHFDGNLGQDIFMQFDEMILNFKFMYIDFN